MPHGHSVIPDVSNDSPSPDPSHHTWHIAAYDTYRHIRRQSLFSGTSSAGALSP